ncbi:epidermal growth factor receptor kinase substrate 8-like protein 1 isoform X2 [Folsomia candida]|nr:epidermal growth factor receptor kinase substrate 8-like protein 1 isoform X2 [Folsomia candida]
MDGGGGMMGNVYEVEHLATFQLSEELNAPSDGMRRLLHMEKNGFGIWSQKMRVRLERNFIVILDFENGDEMERFPLPMIREPTAFTNSNPGELYNNIFAFIVHPVEMHIFQCFNISAADLVEDVKLALAGRVPPSRTRHTSQNSLPPPPVAPPPEPPHFKSPVEDSRDDTSSIESEGQYEREVAILNRCFDDIERFIARLQYAAAAYRELQRRRKSKKSKKKDHGEGLLSMRARPPHEREFVDILQKFKLSFNLLARLKAHIHDPNSPELVHFLFTPLALIVDASRDAHAPGLASRVVSPLLSREAVDLLTNCLTSKETELWHSLGDAWHLAREQWKGYVAPYQPVFMDGWSPTIRDPSSSSAIGVVAAEAAMRRLQAQQEAGYLQQQQQQRNAAAAAAAAAAERQGSVSPVEMPGDDFGAGQRAFLDSIRSRGGRMVVVTHPRTKNNHKELTVVRGEYLEVLDDTKKWWKARNWKNEMGYVPHTIVSPLSEYPQQDYPDNGRSGRWSSPSSTISSDDDFNYSMDKSPPPPPPQPSGRNALPAQSPNKKKPRDDDLMQQELKNVLTLFREKRKIEIQKTPEVFINQHSSVDEVQEWLKVKGFSERIRKQLSNMNGNELFSLKKAQLEAYCGKDEGRRLDSQITISRISTGFKTTRSSELRAILAKARAKVELGSFDVKTTSPSPEPVYTPPNKYGSRNGSSSNSNPTSPTPKPMGMMNNNNNKSPASKFKPKSRYDDDSDDAPVINFGLSDESDDESDDGRTNDKGTLGNMLKKRRGEILRK